MSLQIDRICVIVKHDEATLVFWYWDDSQNRCVNDILDIFGRIPAVIDVTDDDSVCLHYLISHTVSVCPSNITRSLGSGSSLEIADSD